MPTIHPSAVVSARCRMADSVEIGPGCVIHGDVILAEGVRLVANVCIQGPCEVGANTVLYPGVCLGFPGQDFKFKPGDPTPGVTIGSGCIIREHVTVHAATKPEAPTTVGNNVMMMVSSHLGHDGRIGNNVVLVNGSVLAGHSVVADHVTISGLCAVHQFTRIGRMAFMSGGSAVSNDVPPFCIAWGRNRIVGINLVGLRRSGVPREHITRVREAYRRALATPVLRSEMVQILQELGRDCPPVAEMAKFVEQAKRPVCVGRGADAGDEHPA